MDSQERAYHQINGDSLVDAGEAFWHQHVVNAYAAQCAGAETKRITLAFALIGLYLHVERGFTGRQVQRVHMDLARRKREWPEFALPKDRGTMTAGDVAATPSGPEREQAIHAWCAAVWKAYAGSHEAVAELLREYGL
jgi:hypothetical protein